MDRINNSGDRPLIPPIEKIAEIQKPEERPSDRENPEAEARNPSSRKDQLQNELERLQREYQGIAAFSVNNPEIDTTAQITHLKERIQSLKQQLSELGEK